MRVITEIWEANNILKLLNFIHQNPDWEELIFKPPYHIHTKRKGSCVLFKYTQRGLDCTSDFNIELVRECRGIILDETDNYKPVCVPFFKFANYGEPYADDIDWPSAKIVEKIDGSLIKVWYHNSKWRVSTNGNIDASDAIVGSGGVSYFDVFEEAIIKSNFDYDKLNPSYTYLFELISPKTQVVIPHTETKLYHIGTRNNITLQEVDVCIDAKKPKMYPLDSIEKVVKATEELSQYHEGFVVVDKFYHRIKVKSPLYIKLYCTLGDCTTDRNIIDIIRSSEVDEVLNYFPEHTPIFAEIRKKLGEFIEYNEREIEIIKAVNYPNRKELAERVNKTICSSLIFSVLDGKSVSVGEFVAGMPVDILARYLMD